MLRVLPDGWDAMPLSAPPSDGRASATWPLPRCQAQDNRCCFPTDPCLCPRPESSGAHLLSSVWGLKPTSESPQHTSSREVLATSSSGLGPCLLLSNEAPPLPGRDKAGRPKSRASQPVSVFTKRILFCVCVFFNLYKLYWVIELT